MSRAFTREDDNEKALADIGERPLSPHRNLVTRRGLAEMEASISQLRKDLAAAEGRAERQHAATLSRDLRYWVARRENAEMSLPDPDSKVVRFGMTVTVESQDGRRNSWKIVGEDEADAAKGSVSHVSPMALALFGKGQGDLATVNGKEWEIVALTVEDR